MAASDFFHGIQIKTVTDGIRSVETAAASIIGVIGTAPEADDAIWPINTPVLVLGESDLDKVAALGTGGTLYDAIDSDILGVTNATIVAVRVEDGADIETTQANLLAGTDPDTGKRQGIDVFRAAESQVGAKPRLLCAPGFTHQRAEDPENSGSFLANPVATALNNMGGRLRAVAVIDGPNTNDAEAVAAAGDFGSKRVFLHDPFYTVFDAESAAYVQRPASARICGLIALNDQRRGWHTSPSNVVVPGISGLAREIDYAAEDPDCRANFLNASNVATTIRDDGFRLWGNRTTSQDQRFAFLAHVRIQDILNDSLAAAHRWARDRNITTTYVEDVTGSVNAFIARLKAERRIAGGRCYAPPELNKPADQMAGRVVFAFEFSPYGIAENITFKSAMVNDYLEDVVADAAAA
ncbi:phage tail sheath subtilisin-like domain-containing protein [Salinisphaera orenii]|uniref:Tail protein n=1 Tax=Salinisphaera orenii YIM 95161 TaxID=1051139 RepID=A0A423PRQ5_9GAMM|nr:phage tail sheath subtilisin-like domain-containing protein [Salinisphaera halophila]ROO28242.1 tail protein [Salinisphaera halophila YIM 95161]